MDVTEENLKLKNGTVDLTIGSLWANIWHMSWPMLIIMLLNFLVGVVDVYVAGLISPEVQAAVGFISQIFFLTIIIANAISIGSLALVARAVGAGDPSKAVEVARQSLMFGGIIALALTVPGLIFYNEIVTLAGFPSEIREIAGKFLQVFAISLGANYLLIISNSVFRACGEVKKPLLTMTVVSIINIVLNFVLVFGIYPFPKMGYIGIAVASAFSVAVGTVMNLLFFRFGSWAGIYKRPWSLSGEIIRKTLSISWPAALLQIAWNAGSIILYNILSRLGDASITALAAITNGFRIEGVIFLPAFALNMAASVLIGQNLGAGNPDRAEKVGWKIGMTGVVLMSHYGTRHLHSCGEDRRCFHERSGCTRRDCQILEVQHAFRALHGVECRSRRRTPGGRRYKGNDVDCRHRNVADKASLGVSAGPCARVWGDGCLDCDDRLDVHPGDIDGPEISRRQMERGKGVIA